nr:DUF4135 domain-containing protein [Legionella jordanis]
MPKLKVKSLEIEVPDAMRAACYLETLEKMYESMTKEFAMDPHLTFKFFKKNTVPKQDGFKPSVLKSLLENFARQLDKEVMYYLDKDMMQYLEQDRKLSSKARYYRDSLSREQASKDYSEYFNVRHKNNAELFAKNMKKNYPNMSIHFAALGKNSTDNSLLLLARLKKDWDLLKHSLLEDWQTPELRRIISSGSDFHKHGQQVLILEFTDGKNGLRKVIYKPSPVTADAMLFGDLQRLSKIDPAFTGEASFIELVNLNVLPSVKQPIAKPLPTYLIIPRIDDDKDSLANHYGYIEYLSHSPSDPTEYEDLLLTRIKKARPSEMENDAFRDDITALLETTKEKFLALACKHAACDFLVKGDSDRKQYSYDCGMLLAVMTLTGLSDSHLENIIIHELRPMLIDGEACFCQRVSPTPQDFSAFDAVSGSMNALSTANEDFYFLFDITGIQKISISKGAKNVLYEIDENGEVVACQPDKELLKEGYRDGLELMAKHGQAFLAWFEQPHVMHMMIRVIPQKTSAFASEIEKMKREKYSYDRYEKYCLANLRKNGIDQYYDAVVKYNSTRQITAQDEQKMVSKEPDAVQEMHSSGMAIAEDSAYDYVSRELPPYPVPNGIIFANDDRSSNIFSEYQNNSVPVYYTRASSKELLDFNGNPLSMPIGFQKVRDCIGQKDIPTQEELLSSEERYKLSNPNSGIDEESELLMTRLPSLSMQEKQDSTFVQHSALEITKQRAEKILTFPGLRKNLVAVAEEQVSCLRDPDASKKGQKQIFL